jgi:hypothetical protein
MDMEDQGNDGDTRSDDHGGEEGNSVLAVEHDVKSLRYKPPPSKESQKNQWIDRIGSASPTDLHSVLRISTKLSLDP